MRILIMILLTSVVAFAQEGVPKGPAQGPPPKNLTKQADGHVSANTEPASTQDFEVHVVVPGDTLSRLAAGSLNDMKLWPQLWEQNAHIVNPHWIYPNDKVLVRKVTPIAAAAPPPPDPAPAPAPEPPPAPQVERSKIKLTVAPAPVVVPPARSLIEVSAPRTYSEIKAVDVNCSGFIRTAAVPTDLKVSGTVDSETAVLAGQGEYVYLTGGVQTGGSYQIIRPTRKVDSPGKPAAEKNLGTHYLQIAQVQVVMGQDNRAMARVTSSCEAAEVGDLIVPYTRPTIPTLPQRRPFSSSMKGSGQVPGKVVLSMSVLVNATSAFKHKSQYVGAGQGPLTSLERGIAGDGNIVYVDVARSQNVRPGDLFIVFRDVEETTFEGKKEKHRVAIGEIAILTVEDRASTALVTYSTDAIALGDDVERR